MAPGKPEVAADFNAIIKAGRERRRAEVLASEIFGKNRRSSAPGAGNANRKPGTGPSLASRIGNGVTKQRAVSSSINPARQNGRPGPKAGDVDSEWTHDLHSANSNANPRGLQRGARQQRGNRGERLYSAINASASSPAPNNQFNIIPNTKPTPGMTIRGRAGPYTVVAENFASGTTAADIESATTSLGSIPISCYLTSERPTVTAELIYETKEAADVVVDTFNKQNADGNLLHVYHKNGPAARAPQAAPIPAPRATTPQGPRAEQKRSDNPQPGYGDRKMDRYAPQARSRDPPRRGYEARADIVDGTYGFDDRMDTDDREDKLYSDSLAPSRGRGGRGNSRDRGRGDRGRYYN